MDIYIIPPISKTKELDDAVSLAWADIEKKKIPLKLTPREKEILQFLANGYTSQEIADNLGIKPYTVRTHQQNIRRKFGVHSLLHAVAEGIRKKTIV